MPQYEFQQPELTFLLNDFKENYGFFESNDSFPPFKAGYRLAKTRIQSGETPLPTTELIEQVCQITGKDTIKADEMAQLFIDGRTAMIGMAIAVRAYFEFKQHGTGSRGPIDAAMTAALWELDKEINSDLKEKDKKEKAARKAASKKKANG